MKAQEFSTIPETVTAMQWDGSAKGAQELIVWHNNHLYDRHKDQILQSLDKASYIKDVFVDGLWTREVRLSNVYGALKKGVWVVFHTTLVTLGNGITEEDRAFEIVSDEDFKKKYQQS